MSSPSPIAALIKTAISNFDHYTHRFITGSYDRTCKIWQTETGKLLHTLEGHKNAVYSMAFNIPYGYSFKLYLVTKQQQDPSIKPPNSGIHKPEIYYTHLQVIKVKSSLWPLIHIKTSLPQGQWIKPQNCGIQRQGNSTLP